MNPPTVTEAPTTATMWHDLASWSALLALVGLGLVGWRLHDQARRPGSPS